MKRYISRPVRIDKELEDLLKEFSQKNKIGVREASKRIARISRARLQGNRIVITDEIRF